MISIITPVYNNPQKLEKLLGSIKAANALHEVIVVDDCSSEDVKSVADKFEKVRYIRLDRHAGPSRARNAGAAEARGDFLIFFDSDVVLRPDVLKRFEEHFAASELAVVGEYDPEALGDGFFPKFKALLTESWIPESRYISIFALRAAGIRKDIFDNAGGFDENIKSASVEDYEFADKLSKLGVRIRYDPGILVQHHHPGFLRQMKLFYLRARDWVVVFIARKGRFDNICATRAEGVSSISGAVFLLFLLPVFAGRQIMFLIPAIIAFILYCAANLNFLNIVVKRKGLFFVPIALLVKLPLSVSIAAGFAVGVLQSFLLPKSLRRQP